MYAEERQEAIAALVSQRGRASVSNLATTFDVTTETVRRDLDALERAVLLRRVHGGAVAVGGLRSRERSLAERRDAGAHQKDRIAKAAVALLPGSGGTILLDGGTTTARFAEHLPLDRRLTVVTNSLPAATVLGSSAGVEVNLLGGRLRQTTQACVGPDTVAALGRLRVDVAFVGTNGLTVEGGLTTPDADEAAVKAAMVAGARCVAVLADSSKCEQDYLVRFATLHDIDMLVTDDEFDPQLVGSLQAAGVEVLLG